MISLSSSLAAMAVVAGLLFGSFLNVCIARLPEHRSIAWPGSRCPRCSAPIRAVDNIPLLSFVLLRGRCRHCRKPISLRYPLVEAGLAALFLLAAVRFPFPWQFAEAAVFCFLLLGLLGMDAETLLLPDSFTLPGIGLGLLQATLTPGGLISTLRLTSGAPIALPHFPPAASSLLGSAGAAASLWLIRWLYRLLRHREGMGLGDVKLGALLGAWLGIAGVALTLVLGTLFASVGGLILLARGKTTVGPLRLPFGSFLCLGGLFVLFAGKSILTWYFHFFS